MKSDQNNSINEVEKPDRNVTPSPQKLDQRLEQLNSKLGQHNKVRDDEEQNRGIKDNAGMAYGLKIASEFVSAILVGCVIGWVIDKWLGTIPFGLIFFLILGFAAGVLNVMRATGQMAEPGAKKR